MSHYHHYFNCGRNQKALRFDGVDETLTTGYTLPLDVSQDYTLEAVVKLGGTEAQISVFGCENGTDGFSMLYLNTGEFFMNWRGGTGSRKAYKTTATFTSTSEWYHVVVVKNGTDFKIYVDAVDESLTYNDNDPITDETGSEVILADRGISLSAPFHGDVKYFAIYDEAKSSSWVSDRENSGDHKRPDNTDESLLRAWDANDAVWGVSSTIEISEKTSSGDDAESVNMEEGDIIDV